MFHSYTTKRSYDIAIDCESFAYSRDGLRSKICKGDCYERERLHEAAKKTNSYVTETRLSQSLILEYRKRETSKVQTTQFRKGGFSCTMAQKYKKLFLKLLNVVDNPIPCVVH